MRRRVRLPGARAVVVDAGRPAGRAVAIVLADAGADVVCVGAGGAAVRATAASCADRGSTGVALAADLIDRAAAEQVRDQVARGGGAVDLLVVDCGPGPGPARSDGSASRSGSAAAGTASLSSLDAVVHTCDAFGEAMAVRGRGQVVVLVTDTALRPRDTTATAAAGALAYARARRAVWRRRGVGVSVVCAGDVAGPRSDSSSRRALLPVAPEAVAAGVIGAARWDRGLVLVGARARLARPFGPAIPVAADTLTVRPSRPGWAS